MRKMKLNKMLRWGMALGLLTGAALAQAQEWQTYSGRAKLSMQYPAGWKLEEWKTMPKDAEAAFRDELEALIPKFNIPAMPGMDHSKMIETGPLLKPVLHLVGHEGEDVIAGLEPPPMEDMMLNMMPMLHLPVQIPGLEDMMIGMMGTMMSMPGMSDMMAQMMDTMLAPSIKQDVYADSTDGLYRMRLHMALGKTNIGLLVMKAPMQVFDQVDAQVFDKMSQEFSVK